MIDFISTIKQSYEVTERNPGQYSVIKKKGMTFNISGYEKQEKVREYTNGLLSNGGPSTNHFKNMIGEDAIKDLFTKYIFSSDCSCHSFQLTKHKK